MTRLRVAALLTATSIVSATCSRDSPATPTAPSPTRIIRLGGNLSFGDVQVGQIRDDGILVVSNIGNSIMTVTGISGPSGGAYTASWTNGAISAGATQNVSIRFAPTAAQDYTGVITVSADQTSGTNTIAVIGVGTAPQPSCSYSLNPSALTLGATGSFTRGTIQLTTTAACAWTLAVADSWLTSTPMSGTGSSSLAIEAADNVASSGASRVTRLSVDSATTTVTQNGELPPEPVPIPSHGIWIGAICNDGTSDTQVGRYACLGHGGVRCWKYSDGSCIEP
jgi:ASPM-SPD-2-Hydin domain-containing protein